MDAKATVFIDRMAVHAPIGVLELERELGNDFEVTVSIDYPPAVEAGLTDNLALTIDYGEVAETITLLLEKQPMLLVERAARLIVDSIRERWPEAIAVTVRVAKLAPPVPGVQCRSMGATFQWSR